MGGQEQVKKDKPAEKEEAAKPKKIDDAKTKKLKEDVDNLMDEIDDILETEAEEFVKNYVQRGGE